MWSRSRSRHWVGFIRHRIELVHRQRVIRHLSKAHFRRARIDFPRHAAPVACVRHEQNPGAAQFELPDEMIELASENALARAFWCRFKAGQQEYILHAVGLRALDRLRLLGAVSGDRKDDKIVRLGPLNQAR